jgi:hypothetical protein
MGMLQFVLVVVGVWKCVLKVLIFQMNLKMLRIFLEKGEVCFNFLFVLRKRGRGVKVCF